jgi:hypothetical protein
MSTPSSKGGGRIKRSASKTISYVDASSEESDGDATDESEVYEPPARAPVVNESAASEKKPKVGAKKGGASGSASGSAPAKSRKRKSPNEKQPDPLTDAQEELYAVTRPDYDEDLVTMPKVLQGHQERDITKKGKRKNKFLFCLPGKLMISANAKLGEIENLDTDQPTMYMDFPGQGRLKLVGQKKYPAQQMMTMQCKKDGPLILEDVFQQVVMFSSYRWVGTAAENPKEEKMDVPKELQEGNIADSDFERGATPAARKSSAKTSAVKTPRPSGSRASGRSTGKKSSYVDPDSDNGDSDSDGCEVLSSPVKRLVSDKKLVPTVKPRAKPRAKTTPKATPTAKRARVVSSSGEDSDIASSEDEGDSLGTFTLSQRSSSARKASNKAKYVFSDEEANSEDEVRIL